MSKYLEAANGEVTFEEILEPSRHQNCSQVLIGKRLMWACATLLQYHILLEHFGPVSNFLQEKNHIKQWVSKLMTILQFRFCVRFCIMVHHTAHVVRLIIFHQLILLNVRHLIKGKGKKL